MTGDVARVLSCGVATVQDGGRSGYAGVGVATSGPLHRERYEVAATLVTRQPDGGAPAIELLAGTLVLEIAAETTVAVVGPARCRAGGVGDSYAVATHAVLAVRAGERLVAERDDEPGAGPVYVAVGGWSPERVLGSAATDTFGRIGGAVVAPGYRFRSGGPADPSRVGAFWRPVPPDKGPVRVITTGAGAYEVVDTSWRVGDVSRSGVRLTADGGARGPAVTAGAPSRPVVAGTVQCTPGGEVIVLGPDGGVTGGYPVAGVVATVDLDRLSLLAPGDRVQFAAVSVDAAADAFERRRRRVRRSFGHPDLVG